MDALKGDEVSVEVQMLRRSEGSEVSVKPVKGANELALSSDWAGAPLEISKESLPSEHVEFDSKWKSLAVDRL